jgi:uncharacterized protein YggU (UPF0235/DUF167 family)
VCQQSSAGTLSDVADHARDGGELREGARVLEEAFGVRRHAVRLVAGASSRMKVVEVAGADPPVLDCLLNL